MGWSGVGWRLGLCTIGIDEKLAAPASLPPPHAQPVHATPPPQEFFSFEGVGRGGVGEPAWQSILEYIYIYLYI